ncbi:acetoacetate decarboxylase family protein [Nocardioides bigeumensis]|uniref:Acetoacetate decarboxylase n=1 Tax=Nocardioides bigeumensis TaxID=433657 RepID=A0ABP5JTW5_9ACTN
MSRQTHAQQTALWEQRGLPAGWGSTPPFTRSGTASMSGRSAFLRGWTAPADEVDPLATRARGLVVRMPLDLGVVARHLPAPLQPRADADGHAVAWLVALECQSAYSGDRASQGPLEETSWHEASLLLPFTHGGEDGLYTWVRYHERDHGVMDGAYAGIATKQALFSKTFPFAGQPLNRTMSEGTGAIFVAARFDARVLTARYVGGAGDAVDADGLDELRALTRGAGRRYLPDWVTRQAPLVDDVLWWTAGTVDATMFRRGTARVELSSADEEGLAPFVVDGPLDGFYAEWTLGRPGPQSVVAGTGDTSPAQGGPARTTLAGDALRGSSPPFNASGRAATLGWGRSSEDDETPIKAGHVGMYIHWRADLEGVREFLPPPFELNDESDRIWLFMNQTQTGVNKHRGEGAEGATAFLADVEPHHMNWHEAMFRIPCSIGGQRGYLLHLQYKDHDHSLHLGFHNGFTTKRATFVERFPLHFGLDDPEFVAGEPAEMCVSRRGQRIVTASFSAQRELTEAERETGGISIFGTRFFPDLTRSGAPPLVHDVVEWRMAGRRYARGWSGEGRITFGGGADEQLTLLEPVEMLPSLFVHLQYQSGLGTCRQVHDYVG